MFEQLNIELTNRCNKSCYFCGRAKARAENTMHTGDIPMDLFDSIMKQYSGTAIQFNRDGEPLLYPALGEVGRKCKNRITNIVTNGMLLWDRRKDLEDFTTITISVFEDDVKQFDNIKKFISHTNTPKVYVKYLGDYENKEFDAMGITTLRRTIHEGKGDVNYSGGKPPIPEFGVCLDFLFKPSINYMGDFSICNRYDPDNKGVLGNVKTDPLTWLWNNPIRLQWLDLHKQGKRNEIPLCNGCEFWGIPTNG